MNLFEWLLPERFRPWGPPALPAMRLAPENTPHNPLMLQCFTWNAQHEGKSWWKHLEDEIPRLAELGFTQLWLPPMHKAMHAKGQGYDAYDLWDLGEFDQKGTVATRWGTKEELMRVCSAAKEHGIDIIIDTILNHKLGADKPELMQAIPVDPANRLRELCPPREIEAWTIYNFEGRNNKYSSMKWNHEHFTGVDWDQKAKMNGVYRIVSKRHKGWSRGVDKELGNYDYLLGSDIDHRHPAVVADLQKWGAWILETTGGNGYRLDAVKHFDRRFLRSFLNYTRAASGKPRLFAVAEYWSANVKLILPYIRAFGGSTAFFDVPLHDNFHQASKRDETYDLRTILDNTVVKARPGDAVTFVDNHDTEIGQSLESWVGDDFKLQAYALILLRADGYPCVFWGDLRALAECGPDSQVRNRIPAIGKPLEQLILARKLHAYGPTRDYSASRNCIGWVRLGDASHGGCVVVITNGSPSGSIQELHMKVDDGKVDDGKAPRKEYVGLLDPDAKVAIDEEGWGIFKCPSRGVAVYIPVEVHAT